MDLGEGVSGPKAIFGPFSRPFSDFWDPAPGDFFRVFFETFWLRAARLLLRGPRNLNDSIAKRFRACFLGHRAIIARYVAKKGVSHRGACVKLSSNGGCRTVTSLGQSADLPMGFRSDGIAISRDMGPPSFSDPAHSFPNFIIMIIIKEILFRKGRVSGCTFCMGRNSRLEALFLL